MREKQERTTPVITVPKGYDLFDLIDEDDKGYEFGEPILIEEVEIEFER